MSKYHFLLFLGAFLLLAACKNGGETASEEEVIVPINMEKGGDYTSLEIIRAQANAMINARIKDHPKTYSFLIHGFWHPEFVFDGQNMSKEGEYEGQWVDFHEDYTYSYGIYDKTLGSGRYHFRLDDEAMIMLDDDPTLEPKFWNALSNGTAMALVGTHELDINNGMQIKMIPIDNKPVKATH